jgi:hypothetical protein
LKRFSYIFLGSEGRRRLSIVVLGILLLWLTGYDNTRVFDFRLSNWELFEVADELDRASDWRVTWLQKPMLPAGYDEKYKVPNVRRWKVPDAGEIIIVKLIELGTSVACIWAVIEATLWVLAGFGIVQNRSPSATRTVTTYQSPRKRKPKAERELTVEERIQQARDRNH